MRSCRNLRGYACQATADTVAQLCHIPPAPYVPSTVPPPDTPNVPVGQHACFFSNYMDHDFARVGRFNVAEDGGELITKMVHRHESPSSRSLLH